MFAKANSNAQFSANQDVLVTSRYVNGNQTITFVEVNRIEARTTDIAVFFNSRAFYNAKLSDHE